MKKVVKKSWLESGGSFHQPTLFLAQIFRRKVKTSISLVINLLNNSTILTPKKKKKNKGKKNSYSKREISSFSLGPNIHISIHSR